VDSCSSTCVDERLSTQVDIAAPQRPLGAISIAMSLVQYKCSLPL